MFRRLRAKLSRGLEKTRRALGDSLARVRVVGRRIDDELLDELEEILVEADLGVELAGEIREGLSKRARGRTVESIDELVGYVREQMLERLVVAAPEPVAPVRPRVTLVVGVNGSGKTTTVGKLAARWTKRGRRVVVGAADTFRAAAVEQLAAWGERAGARVVRSRPGTDPAAVAFDAVEAAVASEADDVIIDTAGRLHNKKPLMDELAKIARVVGRCVESAPHDTLLVVDGTTGRNAVAQAREFARVAPVTGLVLTKLDGTARGGVAVAIGRELGLPVRYVGVGEGIDDLLDFDPEEFLAGLLQPVGGDAAAEPR